MAGRKKSLAKRPDRPKKKKKKKTDTVPRRRQDSPPETYPHSPEGRGAGATLLSASAIPAGTDRTALRPTPIQNERGHLESAPAASPDNWPVEVSSRSWIADILLVLGIALLIALAFFLIEPAADVARATSGG